VRDVTLQTQGAEVLLVAPEDYKHSALMKAAVKCTLTHPRQLRAVSVPVDTLGTRSQR